MSSKVPETHRLSELEVKLLNAVQLLLRVELDNFVIPRPVRAKPEAKT